jgi:hypothetical protein
MAEDDQHVLEVIKTMTDYANAQNNTGLRNVLLAALIALLSAALIGILSYAYQEIQTLSVENANLRGELNLMKMRQELRFEERDRILFGLLEDGPQEPVPAMPADPPFPAPTPEPNPFVESGSPDIPDALVGEPDLLVAPPEPIERPPELPEQRMFEQMDAQDRFDDFRQRVEDRVQSRIPTYQFQE